MTEPTKRADGWYWVKPKDFDGWTVGFWNGRAWSACDVVDELQHVRDDRAYDWLLESEIGTIGERIAPPWER